MKPGRLRIHTTTMAMTARVAIAPKVPQKMTLRCLSLGRLRATRPMIRALSPASTRSIRTMANRADRKAAEKNSSSTTISPTKTGMGPPAALARRQPSAEASPSSELDRHLVDRPVRRGAQRLGQDREADSQGADAGGHETTRQQEFEQRPVPHRQHAGLAAEIEQGEFGLAEQHRIDRVAERRQDHAQHDRRHEQLAARRYGPD